ncbi:MAG: DUF736 domain-containing protein [Mesorhizobium sp.]|uniref:DUF736 domain-containing protein n=1 Tax=Mesorhizobium sp. TaxID=1871066 RepID=UPI001228203D|nr:DUF736 domain-containing protein [Mesorhizobium sp.]TIN95481.1 MAG: DUF736 domain-containing protein [Mesorhizobium sp.]TJU97127.1 MAG: DUF736 domain-containing protein [Mesorhizobium sp.]
MPQIGEFTRTMSGYSGHLRTLTLDVQLALVPAEPSDAENAPDYRVHLGDDGDGPEVGPGWKRTGEKAGEYLSLLFDDPPFTQPIRANLFRSDADNASWSLQWNRPRRHGEQD